MMTLNFSKSDFQNHFKVNFLKIGIDHFIQAFDEILRKNYLTIIYMWSKIHNLRDI